MDLRSTLSHATIKGNEAIDETTKETITSYRG